MPRKPRTREEVLKLMKALGDVPSALVSAESPKGGVWGKVESPGENSPFAETAKRMAEKTPEEIAELSRKFKEQIALAEQQKKEEEFKQDPKNWVGVCNFCQSDVVAHTEYLYNGPVLIGAKNVTKPSIRYYYCKSCLVTYHKCPNKKELI